MSLKITNSLTLAQKDLLLRLDYVGKWNITTDQAAQLITELIAQRRLEEDTEDSRWDVDVYDGDGKPAN